MKCLLLCCIFVLVFLFSCSYNEIVNKKEINKNVESLEIRKFSIDDENDIKRFLSEGLSCKLFKENPKKNDIKKILSQIESKNNLLSYENKLKIFTFWFKGCSEKIMDIVFPITNRYVGYKNDVHLRYYNQTGSNTFLEYYKEVRESIGLPTFLESFKEAEKNTDPHEWNYLSLLVNKKSIENKIQKFIKLGNKNPILENYVKNCYKDVNLEFKDKTFLHYAIIYNNKPFLKFLKNAYELNYDILDNDNKTPLDYCYNSIKGSSKIYSSDKVLDETFKTYFINLKNKKGCCNLSILEELKNYAKNKDFNIDGYQNEDEDTLFLAAVRYNCTTTAEYLLKEFNVNFYKKDKNLSTIFHLIKSRKMMEILIQNVPFDDIKKLTKMRNQHENSVLHCAAENLVLAYVHYLVSKLSFKANDLNCFGETVIHTCTRSNTKGGEYFFAYIFTLKYLIYFADGDMCIDYEDINRKTAIDNVEANFFDANQTFNTYFNSSTKRKKKIIKFLKNVNLDNNFSIIKYFTLVGMLSIYLNEWIGVPYYCKPPDSRFLFYKQLLINTIKFPILVFRFFKNIILNLNCCGYTSLSALLCECSCSVYCCPIICCTFHTLLIFVATFVILAVYTVEG